MASSPRLTLLLYNLCMPVALLTMLPGAWRKMRARQGEPRDLNQRIGRYPAALEARIASVARHSRRIWIHAVSVGEVNIAIKLLRRWLKEDPELAAVISVTTPTAHRIAAGMEEEWEGRLALVYSPLDIPVVIRSVLDRARPQQLVLVEAEVWPNWVSEAKRRGIPVSLINARLSPRSESRFRRFQRLVEPIFRQLNQILVQVEGDVERWNGLGPDAERIHHTGSIKFDPQGSQPDTTLIESLHQRLQASGIDRDRHRILLAASTHPGEEGEIARAFHRIRQQERFADLRLLLVPRHVERSGEILTQASELGLNLSRRSQTGTGEDPDGLLVDSTGELAAWQHLADAVVIGKSFLGRGGQNPAEAITAGKPIIFGPHMENFQPLARQLIDADAAIQLADVSELDSALAGLLDSPAKVNAITSAASTILNAHDGATKRTVERLQSGFSGSLETGAEI